MPRQVATVLLALRKEQTAVRLRLGEAYDVRGRSVVFGDGAGAPKWPQDVRRDFQKLCGRAGIGTSWVPREQRHIRLSAVGQRRGHREDRRRRGSRELDSYQGRLPPSDQITSAVTRDGLDLRRGERLVIPVGS